MIDKYYDEHQKWCLRRDRITFWIVSIRKLHYFYRIRALLKCRSGWLKEVYFTSVTTKKQEMSNLHQKTRLMLNRLTSCLQMQAATLQLSFSSDSCLPFHIYLMLLPSRRALFLLIKMALHRKLHH